MYTCERCKDTGYFMLGFMETKCKSCDDEFKAEAPSVDKIDRRSKSYKKAIDDIMAINTDISRKEAVKMFDEAYVKG